jgi:hypothetical protein
MGSTDARVHVEVDLLLVTDLNHVDFAAWKQIRTNLTQVNFAAVSLALALLNSIILGLGKFNGAMPSMLFCLEINMLLNTISHVLAVDLDILEVALNIAVRNLIFVEELSLELSRHQNLTIATAAARDHILGLLLVGDCTLG